LSAAAHTPQGVLTVPCALAVHACRIVHRDIKPDNILVADGRYKLADLGVAHFFEEGGNDRLRKSDGTAFFIAPECTTGDEFAGFPTDVWALGVTLHIMMTGQLPFVGGNEDKIYNAVRSQVYAAPPGVSGSLGDLLLRMLEKDSARRITLPGILVCVWARGG
jgi:serine/threonine protein kinase